MKFRLKALIIQFGKSREVIDLSAQVTFFHGTISSGKTSIGKLIDACLGGKLPETTAIKQEFVSAQLSASIGKFDVIFERVAHSNQVPVSWAAEDGTGASVVAPTDNATSPIWGDSVYGLSDLIFFLAGVGPMRVRRNKTDPDAPLIALSFRDVMWYCYLEQDDLDSTFYHVESDDPRLPKSRDVMRFVLGYYTERLNFLEQALARETEAQKTMTEAAAQMRKFFAELGYESQVEIKAEIESVKRDRESVATELDTLRQKHSADTHFTDDLRLKLRNLGEQIAAEEQALSDLQTKLTEEQALRSEILATKFKLTRLESASALLSDVTFDECPQCGTPVNQLTRQSDVCSLCGTPSAAAAKPDVFRASATQRDLDARLIDVEASISHREKARRKQSRSVDELRMKKAALDRELYSYDSAFLSQSRSLERRLATLDERLVGLAKDARIPEALEAYEKRADEHQREATRLRREIKTEREKLGDKETIVEKLENYFFEALRTVGFPGLTERDRIHLNRRTWIPFILPEGDESLAYSFSGAGSGGKKTLFNVCYALALHRLASERDLPLPTFLMIDSPMKNIGTDVNRDIFRAVYAYLYKLAVGPLNDTEFVIFDSEMAAPTIGLSFKDRLMNLDDPEHPPLIPYYKGH
jgi:hypothetical protein